MFLSLIEIEETTEGAENSGLKEVKKDSSWCEVSYDFCH